MRPSGFVAVFALLCSGCTAVVPPPPQPVVSQLTMTTPPNNPACRDYTMQATIQGKPQTIVGHACQQPDGSWRIVEGPQGQPGQVVTVYPPPAYAYAYPYPAYYDPWFWGPPVGFSVGALFFVDGHHHFHHFHGFHRFPFHGFHGGMMAHRFWNFGRHG